MKIKLILLFLAIIISLFIINIFSPDTPSDDQPQQLIHNFVNLDQISEISKFRSCQGHVVVPTDNRETARNMKHYIRVKKEFVGTNQVEVFAPFDGKITSILSFPEEGLEGEIWISPKDSSWAFSFQHLRVLDSLKKGDQVKAGQLLGFVTRDNFDIVYAKPAGLFGQKKIDGWNSPYADLDTVFNHMSDETFAEFKNKGINDRQDFIYTKQFRDSNPCKYRDESGGLNGSDHPEDWVVLTSSNSGKINSL
jgi:hypothetical protein